MENTLCHIAFGINRVKKHHLIEITSHFFINFVIVCKHQTINFMNRVNRLQDYNPPKVEIIVVKVEQGFAISNLENPKEGEESEW